MISVCINGRSICNICQIYNLVFTKKKYVGLIRGTVVRSAYHTLEYIIQRIAVLGKSLLSWPLQWRHNERDGASNHQPHGSLLKRLFRRRSKKTSKLRVIGLCVGNSPATGEFPSQRASYAENVSISWRHHELPSRGNHCCHDTHIKAQLLSSRSQLHEPQMRMVWYSPRVNLTCRDALMTPCKSTWNTTRGSESIQPKPINQ